MNAITTRTFKSGNSVAVRLPVGLGVPANVEVTIERQGEGFVVMPTRDPAEEKRKWLAFLDEMAALPKPSSVQEREPIEFPERPGL